MSIDRISILNCKISIVDDYFQVYNILKDNIKDSPHYVTVNNVHTIIEGVKNKSYSKIINNAFMALPDGKPLSIVAYLTGEKRMGRIFGPTFLQKALEFSEKTEIKHFFFGSSEETISKIKTVIKKTYPNVKVVGMISPPFRNLTSEENTDFLNQMNKNDADFIWIGLGAPKQEIWMSENYNKLNKGIMIGIGAGFDYLSGKTAHAPSWMKDFALEWLYRLIQEPKRLWRRYLVTNSLFIWYVFLKMTGLRKFT